MLSDVGLGRDPSRRHTTEVAPNPTYKSFAATVRLGVFFSFCLLAPPQHSPGSRKPSGPTGKRIGFPTESGEASLPHASTLDFQVPLETSFLTIPTTANSTPPPTPPPATLVRIPARSGLPAASAPPTPNILSIWPPSPPPMMPAIELPSVPRERFLNSPPATLPPTAPLTS